MWLAMKKMCFPPGSPFMKALEAEMKKNGGREYPMCSYSELRQPVLHNVSEQEWPFSLQMLNQPSLLYFFFEPNENLEGHNGHVLNTSVFKFPPNLETLNITFQTESLLSGGAVTKLDLPGTDTADKMSFFLQQAKFRREPRTYDEFFDEGIQQYVVMDISNLYLQDQKMHELDKIHLKLKFNADLAPPGWQIGVIAVAEKKFVLKPNGEHVIESQHTKKTTKRPH
jgi:hypothetical protein